MKLKFIQITFILLLTNMLVAQDGIKIKAVDDNTTDYSSNLATYSVNSEFDELVDMSFYVENNTTAPLSFIVTRVKGANTPSAWTNMVCAGEMCAANSVLLSQCLDDPTFRVNVAVGQKGKISLKSYTEGTTRGTANYTLYISNTCSSQKLDSVKIKVSTEKVSLNEIKQNPTFSMYPNPSDEFVTIHASNIEKGQIKVVDLLGNVVYTDTVITASKINTSEFKNGIYFVVVESEGVKLSSKKLVVKH